MTVTVTQTSEDRMGAVRMDVSALRHFTNTLEARKDA